MRQRHRKALLYFAFFLAAFLVEGCASPGTEFEMNRAFRWPEAQGKLAVQEEKNGNTIVRLSVSNAPLVEDFRESAKIYVVWAQEPGGGRAFNLGALNVETGGKGTIESLTPLSAFDIYLTAEGEAEARMPSGNRLLWASVAKKQIERRGGVP